MKDNLAPTLVAWVLYDATTDKQYIRMNPFDGSLAVFDSEEAAKTAKRLNSGTDYERCEYYSAPAEPVTRKLGIMGAAFDPPAIKRAYTYSDQPNNTTAWKLGRAACKERSGGDFLDYGLQLLQHLQDEGFGVYEIDESDPTPQPAPEVKKAPMAWVTEDTVDGQAVNGKPRRIWWENNEGVGMPIYTSQPVAQVGFCEDTALSLAERTFRTEVDERLAEDVIQYAQRLHDLYADPQPAPDVTKMKEALEGLLAIVSDSSGVAGYHLNGEIAEWCEFEEVEIAEEALATYHQQGGEL